MSLSPKGALLSPTFILVLQHLFVWWKYALMNGHTLPLNFSLEFFFEWMVFSQFEHFYRNHWTASMVGATMLIAHWMFLIAGGLQIVFPILRKKQKVEARDLDALSSHWLFDSAWQTATKVSCSNRDASFQD